MNIDDTMGEALSLRNQLLQTDFGARADELYEEASQAAREALDMQARGQTEARRMAFVKMRTAYHSLNTLMDVYESYQGDAVVRSPSSSAMGCSGGCGCGGNCGCGGGGGCGCGPMGRTENSEVDEQFGKDVQAGVLLFTLGVVAFLLYATD